MLEIKLSITIENVLITASHVSSVSSLMIRTAGGGGGGATAAVGERS